MTAGGKKNEKWEKLLLNVTNQTTSFIYSNKSYKKKS